MLLIGKDTLKVLEARFELKNKNRFGSFMTLCSIGKLRDPWFFSASAMNETFSVKRLLGSRTYRDLMITSATFTSEKGHCE